VTGDAQYRRHNVVDVDAAGRFSLIERGREADTLIR